MYLFLDPAVLRRPHPSPLNAEPKNLTITSIKSSIALIILEVAGDIPDIVWKPFDSPLIQMY